MNDCDTCDGTGYVCRVCGHADGDCTCDDGPELAPCPDCTDNDDFEDEA